MRYLSIIISILTIGTIGSIKTEATAEDHQSTIPATPLSSSEMVSIEYHNESLIDIGNSLAQKSGVNILFPSGTESITQTATFVLDHPVSLDQAWVIYTILLDAAGYSLIKQPLTYKVVKTTKDISKEAVPVYIGTPIDQLPEGDVRIRYLAYLSNVKVTDGQDNIVMALLKELLSENARYQTDEATNSVLIVDTAANIRAAMRVILALDQTGVHEDFAIVALRHTVSGNVAALFNDQILKTPDQLPQQRLRTGREKSMGAYFPDNVRIINYGRLNSLVVIGKRSAIERVRDFIYKYIDVELESGRSILHVYQLQYLRAEEFAPVLENIVKSVRDANNQQAKAGEAKGGTRRMFEDIIIRTDKPEGSEEGRYLGGNKLIIAARTKDWEELKKLIEQLDTPLRQVIIEVLIVDLTIEEARLLGTLMRNPDAIPTYDHVNMQSAQAGPVIVDPANPDTNTVKSDLLATIFQKSNGDPTSVVSQFPAGAAVMSFNDRNGKTWGIGVIQKLFGHKKVLQSPHIIATNNKTSNIIVGETRLLQDEGSGSSGGTTTATRKQIAANLSVKITPRVSSAENVNLNVAVDINDFVSRSNFSDGNRITRQLITNANVANGDVLALGGLMRVDTTQGLGETPILAKIPILGWFFKRRNGQVNRTNLTVFISPTIIEPRLRAGLSEYTTDYIALAKTYSQEGLLFDSLKDPVTRWFFGPEGDESPQAIDQFAAKDEFKRTSKLELGVNHLRPIQTALAPELPFAPACPSPCTQTKEQVLAQLVKDAENPLTAAQMTTVRS